ncbi:purine-nucleoside phosphorylase [Helicobacter mehlei]|uniref:Purine-nucleoside phosphorylase n=1 Tax=Helicobacter mehlei TaxID=2316080 RepID=A0A553V0I5_9HELI|nr:purine-nucleoside phosphorylase [Helicobacter mehlei]TSA85970.1 purine-nucleoside phosphorylase [Helicobacter mehlei]
MFVCAGKMESFSFAKSIGVGLVQSALELSRLCLLEKPASLIFIGSAGTYDFDLPLLSLYKSAHAFQIEESFVTQHSYTPIENALEIQTNDFEALDLPPIKVNSSNYIHTNAEFARHMCHFGIALENMEFFSVLSVARAFNLPSFGIFCTTNRADQNAHAQFLENHAKACAKLQAWVAQGNLCYT